MKGGEHGEQGRVGRISITDRNGEIKKVEIKAPSHAESGEVALKENPGYDVIFPKAMKKINRFATENKKGGWPFRPDLLNFFGGGIRI